MSFLKMTSAYSIYLLLFLCPIYCVLLNGNSNYANAFAPAINFNGKKFLAHSFMKARERNPLKSTNNNNDDEDDKGENKKQFNNDEDNSFMSSLQSRIQGLQEKEATMPLIVLDAMLPRQTLKLQIKNELLQQLIRERIQVNENPTLGMLGKAILQNGDVMNLTKGVEVEIKIIEEDIVEFKAKRRIKLEGEAKNTPGGWTEGKVAFLSSEKEEEEEVKQYLSSENPFKSISNAIAKAREIKSPNMNMPNNLNLIESWIELAKENERKPGQIDTLIKELGKIPSEDEPTELAFWIGSLINPLPAMGVAMEIRPALLMRDTAEERIEIAHDGLLRSIKHMDGSARMW
jgi:hypothetical protein